jgi:hypothetical protein
VAGVDNVEAAVAMDNGLACRSGNRNLGQELDFVDHLVRHEAIIGHVRVVGSCPDGKPAGLVFPVHRICQRG